MSGDAHRPGSARGAGRLGGDADRGGRADDPPLLDLAASVGDGSAVDWNAQAALAVDERERKLLDSLRILAEVARVHGGTLGDDELFSAVSPAPAGAAAAGSAAAARSDAAPAPGESGTAASALPSRWGPLTILEPLGHGGFGDVYRAQDENLQREVAVKFLRPIPGRAGAAMQQLLAEARRLARVRHPHVVHVYGVEERDGRAGMWMELLQGETLSQTVDRQGTFGERETLLIGLDLCRALAALHAAGLIHRDVKAHNVMRETGGRLVLMDLGAGTNAETAPREPAASAPRAGAQPGAAHVGTPVYAAPELLHGQPASPRSDLYALGVLLYHLATCGYPVTAPTLVDLRHAHDEGRRVPLRDLRPDASPGFVRIVERLLEPDPAHRYDSAGELERDLQRALGIAELATTAVRPRRRWVPVLAVAAAAVVLATALIAPGTRHVWQALIGAGPYTVQASLYREGGPVPQRLLDGAEVTAGDGLFLRVEASRPLHVYVLDVDAAGHAYLLFPLRDHVPANPLPPGRLHELPGVRNGAADVWVVTEDAAGEREQLLVVASPQPMHQLEELASAVPAVGAELPSAYPEVDADHLRGISTVRRRAPSGLAAGAASQELMRLLEAATPLPQTSERAQQQWVRRITLHHARTR